MEATQSKTMTRLLKYMLFMFLALSASSCGDDKDDDLTQHEVSIVGEWSCVSDAYGVPWGDPLFFQFREDGTGYEWFSEEPYSNRCDFTYQTYGESKLKIVTDQMKILDLYYRISPDGDHLVIYDWDDNDMSVLEFVRVR